MPLKETTKELQGLVNETIGRHLKAPERITEEDALLLIEALMMCKRWYKLSLT